MCNAAMCLSLAFLHGSNEVVYNSTSIEENPAFAKWLLSHQLETALPQNLKVPKIMTKKKTQSRLTLRHSQAVALPSLSHYRPKHYLMGVSSERDQ